MPRPSPEEQAAIEAAKAAKAAKREAKKAKFGQSNREQNGPAVEMRVPADLDLEKPPWDGYLQALEDNWRDVQFLRGQAYKGPVRWKILRT